MKTLNLAYPDKSDIKYKISKFPDGQQNIVIEPTYWITDQLTITAVTIKSRLNNWRDLELITCAVASLRELGIEEIHLYTPYIMGARSDRKFEEGGNNYLRDVICPIINSLNFKSVTCIDPHSDVLEACIKGFRKESNLSLLKWALYDPALQGIYKIGDNLNNFNLISPDAGASKKIYKLADQIGYKGDIITCSKERDVDGKLTKVNVPFSETDYQGKDFIIIDDICDGGATFINIAKELKIESKGKIYLIVTHGIFSKGFTELSKYFDGIYCTNSYSDLNGHYYPEGEDFSSGDRGFPVKEISNLVKQLNIF